MSDSIEQYDTSMEESQSYATESKKRRMQHSDNEISTAESLKKVAKLTMMDDDSEEEEEYYNGLPLTCSICRDPFLNPIVTQCNHYFCHNCAVKNHEKKGKCFVCQQPTNGVFNKAVDITLKIGQVRDRAREMVNEVSERMKKAKEIVNTAGLLKGTAAEITEDVEKTMKVVDAFRRSQEEEEVVDESSLDVVLSMIGKVEYAASSAKAMAEKAALMVEEANAMAETAKVEMAKVLTVMKKVKWNF
ncbi:unnamed protein product [Cochlearia groenlandica]